jgi:hypothetical protein
VHKKAFAIFGTLVTQPHRLTGHEKTASAIVPFQERMLDAPKHIQTLMKPDAGSRAMQLASAGSQSSAIQPYVEQARGLGHLLPSLPKLPGPPHKGWIGAAALAPTIYHGLREGGEQDARIRDLIENRKHQLDAPMVPLSVKAAEHQGLYGQTLTIGQSALSNAISRALVERPLNAAGDVLNKKLYTQPKQNKAFHHATSSDEYIAKAMKENPDQIHGAFQTMRRFGPSLAEDPNAVRSFLRQAAMSNGQIDYATIRMLAETEKFIRHARGQGIGQ